MSLHSPVEFAQIVDSYIDGWRKNGWMPECRANNLPGWTQGGSWECFIYYSVSCSSFNRFEWRYHRIPLCCELSQRSATVGHWLERALLCFAYGWRSQSTWVEYWGTSSQRIQVDDNFCSIFFLVGLISFSTHADNMVMYRLAFWTFQVREDRQEKAAVLSK